MCIIGRRNRKVDKVLILFYWITVNTSKKKKRKKVIILPKRFQANQDSRKYSVNILKKTFLHPSFPLLYFTKLKIPSYTWISSHFPRRRKVFTIIQQIEYPECFFELRVFICLLFFFLFHPLFSREKKKRKERKRKENERETKRGGGGG